MGAWYEFGGSSGASAATSDMHRSQESGTAALLRALERSKDLSQYGAGEQDFAAIFAPLQDQLSRLDSASGMLSGIGGDLRAQALAQSGGSAMAAANAARLSGSGRYGRGGNAALMAARGASQAASGQSAALANALVQGRLANANFESNLLQQRAGVTGAISGYQQGIAGLKEERARIPMDLEVELANLYAAFAGQAAGISQTRIAGRSQENAAFISGMFNSAGQVGAAMAR